MISPTSISSSWVKKRLHTEIQLSGLPASIFFWQDCHCCCDCCDCDGVKTKSTPSLLNKEFDNNIEPEKSLSLALCYKYGQFPLNFIKYPHKKSINRVSANVFTFQRA